MDTLTESLHTKSSDPPDTTPTLPYKREEQWDLKGFKFQNTHSHWGQSDDRKQVLSKDLLTSHSHSVSWALAACLPPPRLDPSLREDSSLREQHNSRADWELASPRHPPPSCHTPAACMWEAFQKAMASNTKHGEKSSGRMGLWSKRSDSGRSKIS